MFESASAMPQLGRVLSERWHNMPGGTIKGFPQATDFLGDFGGDKYKEAVASILLENTLRYVRKLDESTRMLDIGSFEKFIFPIIRASLANLVIADLVTVYPLTAPMGLVWYMDVTRGTAKGRIPQGAPAFSAVQGPSREYNYSSEIVPEEVNGVGTGGLANFNYFLGFRPVRPGSLRVSDGVQNVSDDGNGNLVGNIAPAPAVNTVNYQTGQVIVTFQNVVAAGSEVKSTYQFVAEGNAGIPEVDVHLRSSVVTTQTQKLRANWTVEAQQDADSFHGLNLEVELTAAMANDLAKEINYAVLDHLRAVALAGNVTWNHQPPAGVPWPIYKDSLYDSFIQLSNLIYRQTQKFEGNWIVAGLNVCNVVETMARFQASGGGADGAGIKKIGKIGQFDFYKSPVMESDDFLMGHRGKNFLETGYIWAPYLSLYTTQTYTLDDMVTRKAMMQRSGRKVVNPWMYGTGRITNPNLYQVVRP
jgi:hypothetical protein